MLRVKDVWSAIKSRMPRTSSAGSIRGGGAAAVGKSIGAKADVERSKGR